MKNLLFFIAMAFLFLTGCVRTQLTPEQEEFKSLCMQNSGSSAWMEMEPMKNGEKVSGQKCWGCMADMNNMICNKEEYLAFLKTNANSQKMSMEEMQ